MSTFYQDPNMDPTERIAANRKHDAEPHTVCMWKQARYKGGFGYPPEPKQQKQRMSREEFQKRRAELASKFL